MNCGCLQHWKSNLGTAGAQCFRVRVDNGELFVFQHQVANKHQTDTCHLSVVPVVVKTLSSHEAINSQGEPAEKWDDVVITRLHSTPSTSNGRILFRSLGEKDRSRAGNYEMVRIVCLI